MIGWLLVAGLASMEVGTPPVVCGLKQPALCRDTNALVWSKGFDRAIHAFVGDRQADFLYKGHSVAEQAIDVLGGAPDDAARIGPYWRFTACRAHSCGEKGAVVLLPDGKIVAIGILYSRCESSQPGPACYAHDTLTLFVRDAGPDVIRNLKSWGDVAARDSSSPGLPATTLDVVEVITV